MLWRSRATSRLLRPTEGGVRSSCDARRPNVRAFRWNFCGTRSVARASRAIVTESRSNYSGFRSTVSRLRVEINGQRSSHSALRFSERALRGARCVLGRGQRRVADEHESRGPIYPIARWPERVVLTPWPPLRCGEGEL